MIQTIDIHKNFDELHVLKGINIDIKKGEIVTIVGPSGAGKTTFLQIVGTLDKADKGIILIDGQDVSKLTEKQKASFRNKEIGFVFQFHHLIQAFTALNNVLMPLMLKQGKPDQFALQYAHELLTAVGLDKFADRKPNELSGGQQQRVAIARALITQPALLLADEPTGNLDTQTAAEMFELFRKVHREHGCAVLLVTHDPRLSATCDRTINLVDGRIQSDSKK